MSPLVRSLLALAVLLATAHADCTQKMFGYATMNNFSLTPINTAPIGDVIEVCKDYLPGTIVGQKIVACNNNPLGPAPAIEAPDDPFDFASITVVCYDDLCPDGATLNITQFYEEELEELL